MVRAKLLSNIYKVSVYRVRYRSNMVIYDYEDGMPLMNRTSINIHELAHKCKEWAVLQGYMIETCVGYFSSATVAIWDIENTTCATRLDTERYSKEKSERWTEPEAIFKACEYILKETL